MKHACSARSYQVRANGRLLNPACAAECAVVAQDAEGDSQSEEIGMADRMDDGGSMDTDEEHDHDDEHPDHYDDEEDDDDDDEDDDDGGQVGVCLGPGRAVAMSALGRASNTYAHLGCLGRVPAASSGDVCKAMISQSACGHEAVSKLLLGSQPSGAILERNVMSAGGGHLR